MHDIQIKKNREGRMVLARKGYPQTFTIQKVAEDKAAWLCDMGYEAVASDKYPYEVYIIKQPKTE